MSDRLYTESEYKQGQSNAAHQTLVAADTLDAGDLSSRQVIELIAARLKRHHDTLRARDCGGTCRVCGDGVTWYDIKSDAMICENLCPGYRAGFTEEQWVNA